MKGRHKVGLVFGSGAARGFSQIGVLKAITERDIPIDFIAGTSVGAIIGAAYAKLIKNKDFKYAYSKGSWKDLFKTEDLETMFKGFAEEKKINKWLEDTIGDVLFSDLHIPLAIVAADALTGEQVVIKEGSVLKAVKASISIPVLFPPIQINDRLLVDGSFVNPIPVDVAKEMGATLLIACDLMQPSKIKEGLLYEPEQSNKKHMHNAASMKKTLKKLLNSAGSNVHESRKNIDRDVLRMFRTMKQALDSTKSEVVKLQLQKADIIITPNVGHIAMLAFSHGKEAVMEGYGAAKKVLPEILLAMVSSKSYSKPIVSNLLPDDKGAILIEE